MAGRVCSSVVTGESVGFFISRREDGPDGLSECNIWNRTADTEDARLTGRKKELVASRGTTRRDTTRHPAAPAGHVCRPERKLAGNIVGLSSRDTIPEYHNPAKCTKINSVHVHISRINNARQSLLQGQAIPNPQSKQASWGDLKPGCPKRRNDMSSTV